MKRMIRFIALVLSAVMLLSATAVASGGQLEIKDIIINISDEMNLDFSGLGLELAAAEVDGGAGIRLGLNAGGADAANIYACVQGNQLLIGADGVGSVYSLDLSSVAAQAPVELPVENFALSAEDEAAIMALGQEAMQVLSGAVTPLESQEIDGVAYEILNIYIGPDQVDSLLAKLAVVLDNHPELFAESGYNNFSEMLADLEVKFSVEGFAAISESGFDAELYLVGTDVDDGEREGLGLQIAGTMESDPTSGADVVALSAILGEGVDGSNFEAEIVIDSYLLMVNGAFASFEISVADAEYEEDGLYAAFSAPVMSEAGHWNLSLVALDESVGFEADCSAADGSIVFFADEDYISLRYAINGADGEYLLNISADGTEIAASAKSSISADDGAWIIPADGQTVNVMTLTEDQMNLLQMEAMTVAMTALAKMAAVNPTVAALLGQMDF